MDKILEGYSNEELMKAIIEKTLEYEVETRGIELTPEDKIDIINDAYNNRNCQLLDNVNEQIHNELEKRDLIKDDEMCKICGDSGENCSCHDEYDEDVYDGDFEPNDDVDETNYDPYMGQDYNESYY